MVDFPMKKLFFLLALFFTGVSFSATVIREDVWDYVYNGTGNTRVWTAPTDGYTFRAAYRSGQIPAVTGTGLTFVESGAVALADGRSVQLTATRTASSVKAAIAIGNFASKVVTPLVVGVALYDLYKELGFGVSPDGKTVTKTDPSVCTVSPCYLYNASIPGSIFESLQSACNTYATSMTKNYRNSGTLYTVRCVTPAYPLSTFSKILDNGYNGGNFTYGLTRQSTSPLPPAYVPSSILDFTDVIAAKTNWTSSSALGRAAFDAAKSGETIPTTPVSVINSPLPPLAPTVQTTTYPKPANITTTSIQPGNPFGLPSNTPSLTRTVTGTAPIAPGNTVVTGPVPKTAVVDGPLFTPTKTTDTATYNPTTNTTDVVTKKEQDAASKTTNITNVTNITNTTNTSTSINTQTTTTSITNTTTNTPLEPTTTKTEETANEPKDPCDSNPDRLGCIKLGELPDPEKLSKENKEITVTAIVFASSAGCPPPIPIVAFGKNYSLSYGPLCDAAAMLKALFVMLGTLAAAYVLADSFRIT